MTRRFLWPLVPLYAAGAAIKTVAYDRAWKKPQRLQWPVVSVGNISTGGSGKTPLVVALARTLVLHGYHVDILSRGYGRESRAVEQVDPHGSARQYGDEPLLIAQAVAAPVFVGASRYEAGLLAESKFSGSRVHLLDDGFQHRRLARSVDICVVREDDLKDNLLPAGNLREPLSALRRATVLSVREDESGIIPALRAMGLEQPVWVMERSMELKRDARPAVAFCGIAHPDDFFSMLRARAVELHATQAFRDHHAYSEGDIAQLIAQARLHAAGRILTTEKDYVRLSPDQREKLNTVAELETAPLKVVLRDEAAICEQLSAWLKRPV